MNNYEITNSLSMPAFTQGILPFAHIDKGTKTNCIQQGRRMFAPDNNPQTDPVRSLINMFSGTIVMSGQELRQIGEIFPQDLIKKGKGSRC